MNAGERIGSGAAIAATDLRQPHGHFDEEGGAPPSERVDAAMRSFVLDVGPVAALRLDSCVHCGMCAEACPFYINTGDPVYTPIHKAEPLKQAYKRETGPFAPVIKLLGLKRKVTIKELREWEELLFDSCTLCGRCSLICPMGIDIMSLIEYARHGMAEAGLVPRGLYEKAQKQQRDGDVLGWGHEEMLARLRKIGEKYGVEIPVDRPGARVMVCTTAEEMQEYPAAVAAVARILKHVGSEFTYCSQAIDASNYGYVEGSLAWERENIVRVVDAARHCGVETVIMPEEAYAYVALRWHGAELLGAPLPFAVKHMSEFMLEELHAGRLRLKPDGNGKALALHESCQLVRRGGIEDAPIALLEAIGVACKRPVDHGAFATCCGGGAGLLENDRARALRYRVFEAKMREIEQTGAEQVVTCCSTCRRTFDEGARSFEWTKDITGLTEIVAEHLAE